MITLKLQLSKGRQIQVVLSWWRHHKLTFDSIGLIVRAKGVQNNTMNKRIIVMFETC